LILSFLGGAGGSIFKNVPDYLKKDIPEPTDRQKVIFFNKYFIAPNSDDFKKLIKK
jgi:hypothetical protein